MSIEKLARVERSSYLMHTDTTEVTVSIPGDHDFTHAENVVIVQKEGK